jgi:hypothetical protein
MRLRRLAVAIAIAEVVTGCAGRPWWYQSGGSSCGSNYMLRIHGHVGSYGGCGGVLAEPPPVLRLQVGEHFDIHVDTNQPTLTTLGVLRRTALKYDSSRGVRRSALTRLSPAPPS